MSWLSKGAKTATNAVKSTVSQPLNVVKKVAEVNVAGAIGVISGFATGGPKGAILGGVTAGAVAFNDVSKTHNGAGIKTIALHSLEAGAIAGGVTSAVSGIASKIPAGASFPKGLTGWQGIYSAAGGVLKKAVPSLAAAGYQLLSQRGSSQPTNQANDGSQTVADKSTPYGGNVINLTQGPDGTYAAAPVGSPASRFPRARVQQPVAAPAPAANAAFASSGIMLAAVALGAGLLLFKRRT